MAKYHWLLMNLHQILQLPLSSCEAILGKDIFHNNLYLYNASALLRQRHTFFYQGQQHAHLKTQYLVYTAPAFAVAVEIQRSNLFFYEQKIPSNNFQKLWKPA